MIGGQKGHVQAGNIEGGRVIPRAPNRWLFSGRVVPPVPPPAPNPSTAPFGFEGGQVFSTDEPAGASAYHVTTSLLSSSRSQAAPQALFRNVYFFFVSMETQPNLNRFALPESLPLLTPIFFVLTKSQPKLNRFALPESPPPPDNRRSSIHPHSWSGALAKERTGLLNKKEGTEYVSVLGS